jgi:hypothetical protein
MKSTRSARYVCGILGGYAAFLAMLALVACAPAVVTRPPATEEAADSEATQLSAIFPLSEPGPYRVGVCEFSSHDASRNGRGVGVRVWYPAVESENVTGKRVIPLADPDQSSAPYPLILIDKSVKSCTI